ncbi:MAG TPA: metal-dependent hydrolase [Candidatus Acidoferrum sp.]|nr:metal-dependent hydrolase [Candidatus Acidoferrum sp.]
MDLVIHILVSLALARGFFPRLGKLTVLGAILAGCVADLDALSAYFGPSAYFSWHGTYTHSILAALVFSIVLLVIPLLASSSNGPGPKLSDPAPTASHLTHNSARPSSLRSLLVRSFFLFFLASLLHIALDAAQSDGSLLLWPFSSRRFDAGWLPRVDPWLLAILFCAIAVPELLRLVGSEIGSKEKRPRGQLGALVGLLLALCYTGIRGSLHSTAAALLQSRNFHGEPARRVWAFPQPLTAFQWHGVVETETALDQINVNLLNTGDFDPDRSIRNFKPEVSPALTAARASVLAQRFLATAHIPKAAIETTPAGYSVTLRDLWYTEEGEPNHAVAAYLELDRNYILTSAELDWARDLKP